MAFEQGDRKDAVRRRCYPTGGTVKKVIGAVLIVLGVLLILLCMPCWAYLALLGVILIVVGMALIRSA